jgi:hypothetical protein
VRAPHLHRSLRCFCLGAFSLLTADVARGEELQFAFEGHPSPHGATLYEYRPLVRAYVEARALRLAELPDAQVAIDELAREPAAAIFARAHAGSRPGPADALVRTVLVPLVIGVAEACGGFDWRDDAFDTAYAELEASLFGSSRSYAAVVPLVGVSTGAQVELGEGLRVRVAAPGELAAHWPESLGLLPPDFGRDPHRLCVLELVRDLPADDGEPPDAPGELGDAVTALRLATSGAIAAGSVIFERLDWRPFGIRPSLPIAAAEPVGEPWRLDRLRGTLAARLRERLVLADEDAELGEALDRWELSLFQADPFRAEQLRAALQALLGAGDGLWAAAVRAALLVGEAPRERAALARHLRALADGETAPAAAEAVRRALVEALVAGDRRTLASALDEALLGLRERPAPAAQTLHLVAG